MKKFDWNDAFANAVAFMIVWCGYQIYKHQFAWYEVITTFLVGIGASYIMQRIFRRR